MYLVGPDVAAGSADTRDCLIAGLTKRTLLSCEVEAGSKQPMMAGPAAPGCNRGENGQVARRHARYFRLRAFQISAMLFWSMSVLMRFGDPGPSRRRLAEWL